MREEIGVSDEISPAARPRRLANGVESQLANQVRRPKSGANSNQRIPSPFMGEG